MKILNTLLILVLLAVGLSSTGLADTLYVDPQNKTDPNVFDRIQPAIDFAKNGDTIEVFPGTYEGGLIIENKSISLLGQEGSEETKIIYKEGPIIRITNADIALSVEGFTIDNASEGVIDITNASATLTDLQILNTVGTAIVSTLSTEAVQDGKQYQLVLRDSSVRNGIGIGEAPSVLSASSGLSVTIEDSYIEDNSGGTGVIEASAGADMTIHRTFICGNSAKEGGAIRIVESSLDLKSSFLSGNTGEMGGAIYIANTDEATSVSMENLHIANNEGTGSAIYFKSGSEALLTNTLILGDSSGAVAFEDGDNSLFTMQYTGHIQGESFAIDGDGTPLAFSGGEGIQVVEEIDDFDLHDGIGCIPGSWEPETDSSLINAGDPEINDPFEFPNNKESNIGAYGGPEAMWPSANSDDDEFPDLLDNCPLLENEFQNDADEDGIGDLCDATSGISEDQDSDGVLDQDDNCVSKQNPDQADLDQDGQGDICDKDDDGDGEPDQIDCAPEDKTRNSKAVEICNGIDDNCDGVKDNGLICNDDSNEVVAPPAEEGWNAVNEEENAEIETYPVSSGDDESGGCQHNKSLPQGLFIMLMTSLLLARIQRETWLKMGFVNHK